MKSGWDLLGNRKTDLSGQLWGRPCGLRELCRAGYGRPVDTNPSWDLSRYYSTLVMVQD
jgi:hypothetical protein